jgi:hypothetical protein
MLLLSLLQLPSLGRSVMMKNNGLLLLPLISVEVDDRISVAPLVEKGGGVEAAAAADEKGKTSRTNKNQ